MATTSSTSQRLNVRVTVSRGEHGEVEFFYDGDGVGTDVSGTARIPVPQGSSLIVFSLRAGQGVTAASFLTRPIQYVEEVAGALVPRESPPPGFLFQRNSNDLCTIIAINVLPEEQSFRFFLVVLVDGKVHGDDPILINQPPEGSVGGGSGGGLDES